MAIKPRWDHKRDANEPAIVAVLGKVGTQTWPVSGEGIPDLICLTGHHIWLLEIKSRRGILTKPQEKFQAEMHRACAPYYVVHDADEALAARELMLKLARGVGGFAH